jgi:hypothetical protein
MRYLPMVRRPVGIHRTPDVHERGKRPQRDKRQHDDEHHKFKPFFHR